VAAGGREAVFDNVRRQGAGRRARKSHGWDALDRLHEKGYISDPKSKAKSVVMTEEGAKRAKELFEKHFMSETGARIRGRSRDDSGREESRWRRDRCGKEESLFTNTQPKLFSSLGISRARA
jgi:Domain of unknown function (DUF6429)